jgi:hypothetical protein
VNVVVVHVVSWAAARVSSFVVEPWGG